jgi:hypothetical protein
VYGIVIAMAAAVVLLIAGFFFPILWILAGAALIWGVALIISATRGAAGKPDEPVA